jgi:ribosome recycling factor
VVEKAIRDSDLGLNPQVDGDLIRIPIPALTEERRKEMVKLTKKNGEECKVAVRKHRRDANEMIDQLDKDGDVGGDEADRAKKKVEEIVAEGIKQVDAVVAGKEKDILEV